MTKRLLLSILIVALFAVMAIATSKREVEPEATKAEPAKQATPVKAPPAPPKDVELKTMLDEYENNEVRADETFKDQVVRVEGHVWEVKKGLFDEIFVTVAPTKKWQLPMVACFVADADAARPFNKGDAVVAEGRVDGLLINVLVRECTLRRR